nr:uncharacterized protein LOC104098781 [Nicotiana tomentosiformis]
MVKHAKWKSRREPLEGVHARDFDLLAEIENAKIYEAKVRKLAYPEEEDFEGYEDSETEKTNKPNSINGNPNPSCVTREQMMQRLRKKIEMLFGNNRDDGDDKKKKRKASKAKELKRVKRQKKVKRENRKVAERELWKAAAKRAMGVEAYDNPSKPKQSMKKETRRNEKSREKWKERVETREKFKEERHQKRRNNIAAKVKVKKLRKIAKTKLVMLHSRSCCNLYFTFS